MKEAYDGSVSSYSPQIKALGIVLLSVAYVLSTNEPELARALTPAFVEKHPILIAATAVSLGTYFTNHRHVWLLIGNDNKVRRVIVALGFLRVGLLLGMLLAATTSITLIIWASLLMG